MRASVLSARASGGTAISRAVPMPGADGAAVVDMENSPVWYSSRLAYIHVCILAGGMSDATPQAPARRPRFSQAQRSARTRGALLESAARGLSRYGYGNVVLEDIARAAGYTRGALYHQFKDKEDLALAVIGWVAENWLREVGDPAREEPDAVGEL